MATNKTDYLKLNDWVGSDPFRREEINANFRTLDAKAKEHNDKFAGKADKGDLDTLTTSLAQKATKTEVAAKADQTALSSLQTQISNIGNGSPKGTYGTLTALQTAFPTGATGVYIVTADGKWYYWSGSAWTAGGTYQSTGLATDSVTETIIADGSARIKKRTVDVFPREAYKWTINNFPANVVGAVTPYPTAIATVTATSYIFYSLKLIPVTPSSILKFNRGNSFYRLGILEFDVNGYFIKDSGNQTTSLTLGNTTNFIRIYCGPADFSAITLDTMLTDSKFTVEITPITGVEQNNVGVIKDLKDNLLQANLNLLDLDADKWQQGTVSFSSGTPVYATTYLRLALKQGTFVDGIEEGRKLYYNIPTGYGIAIHYINSSGILVSSQSAGGWLTGEGHIVPPINSLKAIVLLRKSDDSKIWVSDLNNLEVILSYTKIPFTSSKNDIIKAVKRNNAVNPHPMNYGGGVKYFGHGGTNYYGSENTIESYRVASEIMGMWGAENDTAGTSDGYTVLMHDLTLDRTTTGTGNVSDHTLAEIKALRIKDNPNLTVPTIEEYILACKQYDLYPVIEVKLCNGKEYAVIDDILSKLTKYNMLKNCIITSFQLELLSYVRSKNSYIHMGLIVTQGTGITQTNVDYCKSIGNCMLDVYYGDLTAAMVTMAHAEAIPVGVWTVNTEADRANMEALGVDFITTDGLFARKRSGKTYTTVFQTNDSGVTWTNVVNGARIDAIITKDDTNTLSVKFPEFLTKAISALQPTSKVREITQQANQYQCSAYISGSNVKFNIKENAVVQNVSALSRVSVQIAVEITF